MRKIRNGLIAIAVLGGPASIILAHQRLTETLSQDEFRSSVGVPLMQKAYSECAGDPQFARRSPCQKYIRTVNDCAARKPECDPQSIYEFMIDLGFVPSDPRAALKLL